MRPTGRLLLAALSVTVMASVLPAASASAAVPNSDLGKAAKGLASFARYGLARVGDNAVLSSPLPLTARSMRELLSLDDVFVQTLAAELEKPAMASPTEAQLEDAINNVQKVNDVTATFDGADVVEGTNGRFSITFGVALSASATLPIAYQKIDPQTPSGPDEEGEDDLILSLVGDETTKGGVPVTVSMDKTTLTFDYDPKLETSAAAGSGLSLQVPSTVGPKFTFHAAGTQTSAQFGAVYGFSDVDVTGAVKFGLQMESTINNADGLGGITMDEWATMVSADLFNIARLDKTGDDVDIDLALKSPLVPASPGSLTWKITDPTTAAALASEPTLVTTGELENFANVAPNDVLAGLGQFTAALSAAEASSNEALPFLKDSLADVYSPTSKILTFIKRQSEAGLICGKANTNPPSGLGLPGLTWYCQAYTSMQPKTGSVSWTVSNGTAVTGAKADMTVGVSPTSNFELKLTAGQTRPEVEVAWTDADTAETTGATHTATQRFTTAADLRKQLQASIFGSTTPGTGEGVALSYDAATDGLKFDIDLNQNPSSIKSELDFGDRLRNDTRLAGLSAASTADGQATVNASGFKLDTAFGVDLGSDLDAMNPNADNSQGDRFFTVVNPSANEFQVSNVTVTPDTDAFKLDGKIGYVDVTATGAAATGKPSFKVEASSQPALAVDINPGTVTNGTGVSNSILLNQFLTDVNNRVSSSLNLKMAARLTVAAKGNLASVTSGTNTVEVGWTGLATNPQPTVTPSADFKKDLKPFDIAPQLTGIYIGTSASSAFSVKDPSRNFFTDTGPLLDAGDVLPLTLHNTSTGASCFGVELISATEIGCRDATTTDSALSGGKDFGATESADGTLPDDNKWQAGDGYLIEGDPSALGPVVLETLFDAANRFNGYEAKGFSAKLPLIDLTPKDFVPQFATIGAKTHQLLELFQDSASAAVDKDKVPTGVIDGGPPASLQDLLTEMNSKFEFGTSTTKLQVALADHTRADASTAVRHMEVRLGTLDAGSTSALPNVTSSPSPGIPPRISAEPTPASEDSVLSNDADSDPDLTQSWSSEVQMNLGFPLDPKITPDDALVLAGTGVKKLDITVDGSAMDFKGSFGGIAVEIGTSAKMTGTHQELTGKHTADPITGKATAAVVSGTATNTTASTTELIDTQRDFVALGLQTGGVVVNTTSGKGGASCTVTAVATNSLTCATALTDTKSWESGDKYTYTGSSNKMLSTNTSGLSAGMVVVRTTGGGQCVLTAIAANQWGCDVGAVWAADDEFKAHPTKVLTDSAMDFTKPPVATGQTITNKTDAATCDISSVTTTTVTCTNPLALISAGTTVPRWDKDDAWAIGSDKVLFDSGAGFDELGIKLSSDVIKNTTQNKECVITAVTADTITCASSSFSWKDADGYQLGGYGAGALDIGYTLKGTSPLALDATTAANRYMDSMTGAFTGPTTQNSCAGSAADDVCLRVSLKAPGDTGAYLGTFQFHSKADGTGASYVVPAALTAAVAGPEPLDFSLVTEPLLYLPTMVRYELNGNNSEKYTNVPLIGTDLAAGGKVVEKLETLATADWAAVAPGATVTTATGVASHMKTQIDAVLPTGSTATVTATCGSSACKDTDKPNAITDIRVDTTLSENATADPTKGCAAGCGTGTTDVPLDLGLPGLNMKTLKGGQATSKVGWQFDISFGLDKENGPYLYTGRSTAELQLGADVGFKTTNTCTQAKPATEAFPSATTVRAANFSDRCIDSNIGLFEGTLYDGNGTTTGGTGEVADDQKKSQLKLLTTLDLVAPSGTMLTLADLVMESDKNVLALDAQSNIDVIFKTKRGTADAPDLPVMTGSIHMDFDTAEIAKTPSANALKSIEYRNIMVDKISFFEQFVGPWLGEFARKMQPVVPFLTSLTTPVPVLNEVAKATNNPPVTLLDLLEAYAAYKTKPNKDAKESNWKYLIKVLKVVRMGASVAGGFGGNGTFDPVGTGSGAYASTGGFKTDTEDAQKTTCGANGMPSTGTSCTRTAKRDPGILSGATNTTERVKVLGGGCPSTGCTGKELMRKMSNTSNMSILQGAGITIPWMNDGSLLHGMLVGEDATLVRFDTGLFSGGVGFQLKFGPFMAGPIPVDVYAGLSIRVGFRAAFGIDTLGIRAQREGDASADMMDGFYFDDYDDSGTDIPEVQLVFTITVGAAASIRVFSVGIEGEVAITFGLDLHDPNNDGKIRAAEFRSMGSDPICMWDATGYLDFVLRVFVSIDLVLWTKRWTYELYRLKPRLKMFEVGCKRPQPKLAFKNSDNNIELNIGSQARRDDRAYEQTKTNERFMIRQLEDFKTGQGTDISVTAFGLVQKFEVPAGKKIIANADAGDDAVLFLPGSDEKGTTNSLGAACPNGCAREIPWTLPTQVDGGTGNDTLEGGQGTDSLRGGPDSGLGTGVTDVDSIKGGLGDDDLYGGADGDAVDGGIGLDVIEGGPGTDTLSGGSGADLVDGGAEDDSISGGPGLSKTLAEEAVKRQGGMTVAQLEDPGDILVGGTGADDIAGHFGNDYIFGQALAGQTKNGRDLLSGFDESGTGFTSDTACTAAGSASDGGDNLDGEGGLDVVSGGGGDDKIAGGKGGDDLCGGDGHDLLEGDSANAIPYTVTGCAAKNNCDLMEDTLKGGAGNDRLFGRAGDDTLLGEAGQDYVIGDAGLDKIKGGEGGDFVEGGADSDTLLGDDGTFGSNNTIDTTGADALKGTAANSTTSGTTGKANCFEVIGVVGGKIDITGDGKADAADSGYVAGIKLISGELDFDGSDTITTGDNGVLDGALVAQAGKVDVDGNGTISSTLDAGSFQIFAMTTSGHADCVRGGEGNDALFGGGGGDSLSGDNGNDYATGNDGDDLVRGSVGNDKLYGLAGVDTMYGDSGTDEMFGGDGNDVMWGGLDNDDMEGNGNDDIMAGDAGVDAIIGGSSTSADDGKDTITGDDGNDILIGDNGTIARGTGMANLLDMEKTGVSAAVSKSGEDVITGGPGIDDLFGQGANDVLTGDGTGVVEAQAGADHLVGGAGVDQLSGGLKEDRLIGGSLETNAIDSNAAWGSVQRGDELNGGEAADRILGDNGTITSTGSDRGTMTRLNDAATGDAQDDQTSGNDTIYGDAGIDLIQAQGGNDTVFGDARTEESGDGDLDRIEGNAGADTIYGHGGNDELVGGTRNAGIVDTNVSGAGDTIYGHIGVDKILGDNGTISGETLTRLNDATTGDGDDDVTSNNDTIYGDAATDYIQGQGGNDTVYGDARADDSAAGDIDYIQGNAGADLVYGNGGDDEIVGGSREAGSVDTNVGGGDTIYGNAGIDKILGDNGTISGTTLTRHNDAKTGDSQDDVTSNNDTVYGDGATDYIEAQGGNDTVYGDARADDSAAGDLDYIQGNAGADTIYGNGGDDEIVGGSRQTGIVDTNVSGAGGDSIYGNAGVDRILGDNGTISGTTLTRLDDSTSTDAADDLTSNDDNVYGDGDIDHIQSGGGDDEIYGDDRTMNSTSTGSNDVVQGNTGSDVIFGHGGEDDLTGGSDLAGIVDANVARRGTGSAVGDGISGGPGIDYVLGDNGTLATSGTPEARTWRFYDIDRGKDTTVVATVLSGKDTLYGDGAEDRLFGQGDDDTIRGGADDDRIQGNSGADTVLGEGGADDIVGGSSTHYVPALTTLDNVLDGADVISGSDADGTDQNDKGDAILGDNGQITTGTGNDANTADRNRTVEMHDIHKVGGWTPDAAVSGADQINGWTGRDLIYGQGDNDTINGRDGDDSIEGNAGADIITGDTGNDDIIGGTSAAPTANGGPTAVGSANFPTVMTHAADGNDTIVGNTGDDAVLADNGKIARRVTAAGAWATYTAPWQNLLQRNVLSASALEATGAFGDDSIDGGGGHDELHGGFGQDTIAGQDGDDSVIGDLGRINMIVVQGPSRLITSAGPMIQDEVNVPGTLRRETVLFDQSQTAGNRDTISGGHGNDVVHSGPGDDQVDGNGAVKSDANGSKLAALDTACAANKLDCDRDVIFGDDGNDTIWGGPQHDHIYGGWGSDKLDYVHGAAGDPTVDYKGYDFIYGGWNADVMQADISQPSPNNGVDKLIDAQGAFNAYNVCEGAYGGNSAIRAVDPAMIAFLQALATDDGATSPAAAGSSGFRELSIIFSKDVKANSSPTYPGTPLNFTCTDPATGAATMRMGGEPTVAPSPTPTLDPSPTPTVTPGPTVSPRTTATASPGISPSPVATASPTPTKSPKR